ncbi:MAG: carotenoid oxygenase family protein [Caulobacteraceae bacterium]
MTKPFPDTISFAGYNAPSRVEADIFDLEVHGELPRELNGCWYRMTPDPQFPPRLGDDIYLSGDGMISLFRFEDGHVDYKSRYVRTERFLAERKARKSLFGVYRNQFTDDPSVAGADRTVANTSPIWHAGRLFATKEDGLPYEIDPITLETRGRFDWNGRLRTKTVSAHPKIDPRTGELLFYGYEASGDASRDMSFCVADKDGELVSEEWFEAPYAGMVHDFAITEDYVIFPIFPTIVEMDRLKAGGPHWVSDITQDAYLGVIPRKGHARDLRWFKRPGGQFFHVINAWNEGETITLDLCVSEMNSFPFIQDVSGMEYDPRKAATLPFRWTLDLNRNDDKIDERLIRPVPGDLPRVDERRVGQRYSQCWMGMVDPMRPTRVSGPVGAGFNMVGRLDMDTGETDTWFGGDDDAFQEPQFIPTGAGELDGYVVAVIEKHADNSSDVAVFRAGRIADGPVAVIRMPLRLRGAVHGCWTPLHD